MDVTLQQCAGYGGDETVERLFLLPQFTFAFNSLSAFRIQLFSCHITLQAHNDHSSSSSYAFCKSLFSMTTRVFKFIYLDECVDCVIDERGGRCLGELLAGKRIVIENRCGTTGQRDIMCAISRERRLASPLLVPRRTKAFCRTAF